MINTNSVAMVWRLLLFDKISLGHKIFAYIKDEGSNI
jgi:hypothetical protein